MDVATILILNYNCLNLAWVWETNFNTVGLLQLYLLRETKIDMHNLTYSLNEVFFFLIDFTTLLVLLVRFLLIYWCWQVFSGINNHWDNSHIKNSNWVRSGDLTNHRSIEIKQLSKTSLSTFVRFYMYEVILSC